jgi:hypothetical protein
MRKGTKPPATGGSFKGATTNRPTVAASRPRPRLGSDTGPAAATVGPDQRRPYSPAPETEACDQRHPERRHGGGGVGRGGMIPAPCSSAHIPWWEVSTEMTTAKPHSARCGAVMSRVSSRPASHLRTSGSLWRQERQHENGASSPTRTGSRMRRPVANTERHFLVRGGARPRERPRLKLLEGCR